jgi:hypothetical protein
VFRALVFSIVLTVVTSPSTAVLCRAWCSVQSATVNVCNHSTPTASTNVVADDTCDDVWIGAAAFVREDTGGASAEDGNRAILVAGYQVADTAIYERHRQDSRHGRSLENRPLSTALRL